MKIGRMLHLEGFVPAFGEPCKGIWNDAQLVALHTACAIFASVAITVTPDCARIAVPTFKNAATLSLHTVRIGIARPAFSSKVEQMKAAYVAARMRHLSHGSILVYFELDFAFPPTAASLMRHAFEAAGPAWSVMYTCRRVPTRWGTVNSGLIAYRAGAAATCLAARVASETPRRGQYQHVVDALAKNASDAPAVPLHLWRFPVVVRVAACPAARLALVSMHPLNALEGNCTRKHIIHFHSYHKKAILRCCHWERESGRARCAWDEV